MLHTCARMLLITLQASKDLVCYVSFNDSDTFVTQGPKEHYKSPTTNCLTFRVSTNVQRLSAHHLMLSQFCESKP